MGRDDRDITAMSKSKYQPYFDALVNKWLDYAGKFDEEKIYIPIPEPNIGFDFAKGEDSSRFSFRFNYRNYYQGSGIYSDACRAQYSKTYSPEQVTALIIGVFANTDTMKKHAKELSIKKIPEGNSDGTYMGIPFMIRTYIPKDTIVLVIPGTPEHQANSIRIIKIVEDE
jgi:hypothetical protein